MCKTRHDVLAQSWKKWKRSFQLYVVGTGIEDKSVKLFYYTPLDLQTSW